MAATITTVAAASGADLAVIGSGSFFCAAAAETADSSAKPSMPPHLRGHSFKPQEIAPKNPRQKALQNRAFHRASFILQAALFPGLSRPGPYLCIPAPASA